MSDTSWVLPERGPGRLYQQARDLVVNEAYDTSEEYINNIVTSLKTFVQLENSVRFLLDGPNVRPTTTVISVPFEGDTDRIYTNLAKLIFEQLWGYYLSSNPKTTHHGLASLVLEGAQNSMIRREAEKFIDLISSRNELAARVMRDFHMACEIPSPNRDVYMREQLGKTLDIHLGVRLYTFGEAVERKTMFLPIAEGGEAVERLYYNLEGIVHQNMVAYDELHTHYLPLSEELILREMENTLERARKKGNTRKKLINGLKMNTVLLEDPSMVHHLSLADLYYDKLNRIDLLEEAAQRSRDLFATSLIRDTEITTEAVDINKLKMEDRVYIERPAAATAGEPVAVSVSGGGGAAKKAKKTGEAEEEAVVHGDGLSEL